jgi:hypothetical protein
MAYFFHKHAVLLKATDNSDSVTDEDRANVLAESDAMPTFSVLV